MQWISQAGTSISLKMDITAQLITSIVIDINDDENNIIIMRYIQYEYIVYLIFISITNLTSMYLCQSRAVE